MNVCPYEHPTGTRCPSCAGYPPEYRHISKKDRAMQLKDLEDINKIAGRRRMVGQLADRIARGTWSQSDPTGRRGGEVFHIRQNIANEDVIALWSDVADVMEPGMLKILLQNMNGQVHRYLDKEHDKLTQQLKDYGVEV